MYIPQITTASLIFFLHNILQISAKSTYTLHPIPIPRADTSLHLSSSSTSPPPVPLPQTQILRRQLTSAPNDATDTACKALLLNLAGLASSPTGMSMCYSIPTLNKASGEFTLTINLYQVSPATGNWTTIQPDSLNVNIAWRSVELLQSSPPPATRRSVPVVASAELEKRTNNPFLVMNRTFKGKVMSGWDASDENKQKLALTPIITISAVTLIPSSTPPPPTNQNQSQIKSILPTTEAPFATGTFATSIKPLNPALTTPPFILPGTRFSAQISLVGPLVTAIWALLFAGTLGLGTLGRWRWRVAFRRRARVRDWNGYRMTELGGTARRGGAAAAGKGSLAGYDRKASFW